MALSYLQNYPPEDVPLAVTGIWLIAASGLTRMIDRFAPRDPDHGTFNCVPLVAGGAALLAVFGLTTIFAFGPLPEPAQPGAMIGVGAQNIPAIEIGLR